LGLAEPLRSRALVELTTLPVACLGTRIRNDERLPRQPYVDVSDVIRKEAWSKRRVGVSVRGSFLTWMRRTHRSLLFRKVPSV